MAKKEKAELTDEQREARKAARDARNANKKILRDYFTTDVLAEMPDEVAEAMKPVLKSPKRKSGAGRGPSNASLILADIKEAGQVSDLDLFVKFKVAQREMAGNIRNWIKKAKPEDRSWVRYDKDTEMYIHVGDGEKAPENWDGYVPTTSDLD